MKIFILVFLLSLLISGCQTRQDIAGEQHKISADKWRQLSTYAGREFNKFGYTLVGSINQISSPNENEQRYELVNLSLARKAKATEIDLLNPTFIMKYACGQRCFKISRFDPTIDGEEAFLYRFFDDNEGVVFEFYAELTLINQYIEVVNAADGRLIADYLNELHRSRLKFDDLLGFTNFLKSTFSQETVVTYSKKRNRKLNFDFSNPNKTESISEYADETLSWQEEVKQDWLDRKSVV